jgi:hypothetical protein
MRAVQCVAAFLLIFLSSLSAAQAGILITVDKSTQRMSVAVDGVTRWVWPVSTGRSGYPTPSGAYTAFRMEEDHYSKEWDDAPMPHSIFFSKQGHAIHGTFEGKRLGSPASHGCVRLSTQNAAALYNLVEDHGLASTKVVITGEQPVIAKRPRPSAEEARVAGAPLSIAPSAAPQPNPYGNSYYQPGYASRQDNAPQYRTSPYYPPLSANEGYPRPYYYRY